MFWHVFTRKFHCTAYVEEVTADGCQGALVSNMAVYILTLELQTTIVRTAEREGPTHRPVVVDHIIKVGLVIVAVLTAERTIRTVFCLVSLNVSSLKLDPTIVDTVNFNKLTSIELFLWLWICVEVPIKLSQFPCPLTPVFSTSTANIERIKRTLKPFVREI